VTMEAGTLLERCAQGVQTGRLSTDDQDGLRRWNAALDPRIAGVARELLARSTRRWDVAVAAHEAHRHFWYDFVRDEITIDEMAAFLLENRHYPSFLALLERIRDVQFVADARAAIDENIADEHQPEPHAELMRRLMMAVKERARPDLVLTQFPALVDRTLVFYYGYFCDPWHLVGSMFATERLGTRRVICMGEGLRRLGLSEYERMFTTIHAQCDDHHAGDWLERVIVPSTAFDEGICTRIANGLAACLETSRDYLDSLSDRTISERLGSVGSWPGESANTRTP
jgi:hypothetical protein